VAREQELLAAFIEFADTIVDEYDVVEFLHRLAERCVKLLNASEAGIMLANRDSSLHYVASSSERMRLIELFEIQHEEGPCLDAYRTGVAVHCVLNEEAQRLWPRFAPHAREVGFEAVSALPMRLRSEVIGALNLFSTSPEPLETEDQMAAQALADIATIGIIQERAVNSARVVSSQLEVALESRIVIEQAKGIVAEHGHVSIDTAFTLLRGYARNNNVLLSQTAQDVISGVLSTDDLARPGDNLPS
jgi:transcriptional regulator with GAF, ATPase, and Fis domain